MKKRIITIVFVIASNLIFAQNTETLVDRFSIKAGIIGVSTAYEKVFNDHFTINSEISYQGGFFWGTRYEDDFNYIFTTVLSVEPRYYYNVEKRLNKGKTLNNNAANFISANVYYVPDWLTSSNHENVDVVKTFGIIPKYGLNRNISKNINFEFAFGIGYAWGEDNYNDIALALDLRLSFDFVK